MASLALVVQNDGGTRKLLDVLLTRFDCEVDAVANGSDALLLLERIDYDLMVVDLITPGASGTDIVEWLRAHRPAALERTAMLSAAPPSVSERILAAHPVLRVIRKPFELAEVLEFIERARRRTAHAPLGAGVQFSRRSIAAGAKAGVLARRNGSQLELVHTFGYDDALVASWFPLPASAPVPLSRCASDGRARWIASPAAAAAEYPDLAAALRKNQSAALASLPVVQNGVVVGAAGWTFREPQPFDEHEQRAFADIAAEAAAALASDA